MTTSFFDPSTHGFARVAVAVPRNRVADPQFNAQATVALYRDAAAQGAVVVAFPELGLSAYTCDDLFHQSALLDACEEALQEICSASAGLGPVAIVGMPLRVEDRLFNCAVAVGGGRPLAVWPKSFLPNYAEFYEARQFSAAASATCESVNLCGHQIPFGTRVILQSRQMPLLKLHVEICEDVWVPIPPSSHAALAGATLLVNLSASNIIIAKSEYRHRLVSLHSARCLAAYLYSSAGIGESTTDLAWDGQALIYESGDLLAQSERFVNRSHLILADVDLERLAHERMRQTSFGDSVQHHRNLLQTWTTIPFETAPPAPRQSLELLRPLERFPYVPADASTRDERCMEVFNIQVQSLVQRLDATGIRKMVIGISGGLDSTHALLVCARAADRLGLPRASILGFTMPGFATSQRTRGQAWQLMQAIGCSSREIDIRPSCQQMLADLEHPFSRGEPVYDVTFENVQAGERTSHLFRLANQHQAIVIGTGDLSELALGWCTYGVGDHMSHYNVNASVPKTLIQHLVRWVAHRDEADAKTRTVLEAILETEVSPELVPASPSSDGATAGKEQPGQKTEDVVGPYELQDFHLYYTVRHGFRPTKVAFLAYSAWHDEKRGTWPDDLRVAPHTYGLPEIRKHLGVFLQRFFATSQFKRSCVPNSPKVGSGGSLSPRGDWRAPSDSSAAAWLANWQRIPTEESSESSSDREAD